MRFYCDQCADWTPTDREHLEWCQTPRCDRCGEHFSCGECGYEIDAAGNCQRPCEESR